MFSNELLRRSTPEELTVMVNYSFLREDQPLIEQQEKLDDCLFLIYNYLGNLRLVGSWTNLEVNIPAEILNKAGFVSTEQEDHLTEADKVSLMASFEPDGVLTLEERYFRTDPIAQPDIQLSLHRDMTKKFMIKKAGEGSFEITLDSLSSPQTRLSVFPTSKNLPQAYQEVSGKQFSTTETMKYAVGEITSKDINRLLFILFTGLGLSDIPLHPPSSLVKNGN